MPKPNQFYFELALSGDYEALVEAITNQQFNPLARSPCDATVWHYLAQGGHYDKLVQAISENRFDPHTTLDNNRATVWHSLALCGHYDKLVQAINENRFDPDTTRSNHGATVWHALAQYGYYDKLVQAINENRFNPDTTRTNSGSTVWYILAQEGYYDKLVQAINEDRFNPDTSRNNYGATVWHALALSGHYAKLVQAISENKFNPETTRANNGRTVWHVLAFRGYYDKVVQAINENRFNPHTTIDNNRITVLEMFLLTENNHHLFARAILESHLSITDIDSLPGIHHVLNQAKNIIKANPLELSSILKDNHYAPLTYATLVSMLRAHKNNLIASNCYNTALAQLIISEFSSKPAINPGLREMIARKLPGEVIDFLFNSMAPLISLDVLQNLAEFMLDNIRVDNYVEIHHILVHLQMKSKFNDNSIGPLIKFKEFLMLIKEEIDLDISLFWGMIDAAAALEADLQRQEPTSSSSVPSIPTAQRELRFSTKVLSSELADESEPEAGAKRLRISKP